MSTKKLNVTVLCGGISAEREISLLSGAAVAEALQEAGHEVFVSDISPTDLSGLDHQFNDGRPADVVFPVLHGTFGEDGQIQALLESRKIKFVGSGSNSCAVAMDKEKAKIYMASYGVPTPRSIVVLHKKVASDWEPPFGFPCVAKPVSEGSSVGCKICTDKDALSLHLSTTLPKFGSMLVEEFIDGFELTVGVLASRTLPIIWIKPSTQFYDYEAKYTRSDTKYVFEEDIPMKKKALEEIKKISLLAFQMLGCRSFGRVDVMVDKQTGKPYVLEINTIPGFTSHSLFPKATAQVGLSMSTLCDQLVNMAME